MRVIYSSVYIYIYIIKRTWAIEFYTRLIVLGLIVTVTEKGKDKDASMLKMNKILH